jgi:hypothetical protein
VSAEHREPAQHGAFLVGEQVVAPVQGGLERPVPGLGGPRPRCEQREPVVEPGGDLLQGERLHPCRRELERQRHAVEPPADGRHGARVRRRQRERRPHRPSALNEELHRRRCGRRLEIAEGLVGVLVAVLVAVRGQGERVDRDLHLSGHGERLAARGEHPDARTGLQQPLDEPGRGLDHLLAVVDDQQHLA